MNKNRFYSITQIYTVNSSDTLESLSKYLRAIGYDTHPIDNLPKFDIVPIYISTKGEVVKASYNFEDVYAEASKSMIIHDYSYRQSYQVKLLLGSGFFTQYLAFDRYHMNYLFITEKDLQDTQYKTDFFKLDAERIIGDKMSYSLIPLPLEG